MKRGFTLIELLVVISIIGVLASVVLSSLSTSRYRAMDARITSDMRQIILALELYYGKYEHYPCSSGPDDGDSLDPLIDEGYLPEGFVGIGGDPYSHRSFKKTPSGPCGQIVHLSYDSLSCRIGVVVPPLPSTHCHIMHPEPLPCSDPYWMMDPFQPDCQALGDW